MNRHLVTALAIIALFVDVVQVRAQNPSADERLPAGALARLGSTCFKHSARIADFALSPDRKKVAVVGIDDTISIWNLSNGEAIDLPVEANYVSSSIVFSKNGAAVAAVLDHDTVAEWDLKTRTQKIVKRTRDESLRIISIHAHDEFLLASIIYEDDAEVQKLQLFDLRRDSLLCEFTGELAVWEAPVISNDANRLILLLEKKAVLYDVRQQSIVRETPIPSNHSARAIFSSKGEPLLAVVDKDRQLTIWSLDSGELLGALTVNEWGKILGFSVDAKSICVADLRDEVPSNIRMLDVATGNEIWRRKAPADLVTYPRWDRVSFSVNAQLAITFGAANTLNELNLASGTSTPLGKGCRHSIDAISFAPDGKKLAATGPEKSIRIWDVESAQETHQLTDSVPNGRSVTFSPDGKYLAATCGNFYSSVRTHVTMWDTSNWKSTYQLPMALLTHGESVRFSPDGTRFCSGAGLPHGLWSIGVLENVKYDGSIEVWDDTNFKGFPSGWMKSQFGVSKSKFHHRDELSKYGDSVNTVEFSPDGSLLYTAIGGILSDGAIRVWDIDAGKLVREFAQSESSITSMALSPDGKIVATTSYDDDFRAYAEKVRYSDRGIKLWNSSTGVLIKSLYDHKDRATCVAFSPDGSLLASGSVDRTVRLWNVNEREPLAILKGHRGTVNCVAFSPDGKQLASGSSDTTILLWDVKQAVDERLGIED